MDGMIVIRKEKGYTSHDVVAKLRGILSMKRIGHTGTLDPQAQGVLPVALGKATRLADMFTEKDKTYEALLHLGIVTDTQDMTGTVLEENDVKVTEEEIVRVTASFEGEQMQIPPMYSALKVGGKKLYELARAGETVERVARPVHFYEIKLLEIKLPFVRLRVTCSKGTYIRTLCHDIGQKLGCGGCMEELVRTRVGRFTLEDALTLSQVEKAVREGSISENIFGIEEILGQYPRVYCLAAWDKLLQNGNPLSQTQIETRGAENPDNRTGWIRMCTSDGCFRGVYQWKTEKKRYYPVKMF